MQIRCPACKKNNVQVPRCQRCNTDLTVLNSIREASDHFLEKSRRNIMNGNGAKALQYAQTAWELEHTAQAARQAFLACLLLRRFDRATQWYALATRK